jgi:hypothetical protein
LRFSRRGLHATLRRMDLVYLTIAAVVVIAAANALFLRH